MNKLNEFNRAKGKSKILKVSIYNPLIDLYNAETGSSLKRLSTCGSCIADFEKNQKFQEWLRKK